jgi:hypothetical protein
VEATEQGVSALLQRKQTRQQDPEDGTILIISILKFYITNLCIMLDSVMQKASTGADPQYLDVWQDAHQGNVEAAEKLVSISFHSYAIFVSCVPNSIFCRTDIWRS